MVSCYLCGKETKAKITGSCIANKNDESVDWLMGKVAKGKTRIFLFSLCEECFNLPNRDELVSEKMESDTKLKTGYAVKMKK